jgi:hypothetical protein
MMKQVRTRIGASVRRLLPSCALAAAATLAVVVPAFASGGLPHLSTLQAGPYSVHIYNDSPTLVIGHNVLTLEVPAEAAGRGVLLELIDSGGRSLPVDLQPVSVLGEEDRLARGRQLEQILEMAMVMMTSPRLLLPRPTTMPQPGTPRPDMPNQRPRLPSRHPSNPPAPFCGAGRWIFRRPVPGRRG